MKTNVVITLMILIVLSIGCSFFSSLIKQQSTPVAVITPVVQNSGNTTTSIAPSLTPGQLDISSATLNQGDFPSGFAQINQEQITSTGLNIEDMLRSALQGRLKEAQPINTTVFSLQDQQNFQIVSSTIVYPLTLTEKITFDLVFFDPSLIIKPILENFTSQINTMPVDNNLGNKASAYSFDIADTSQTGGIPIKGELLLFRRNTAVAIIMTVYPQGGSPQANVGNLAAILDGRLINVLGQ